MKKSNTKFNQRVLSFTGRHNDDKSISSSETARNLFSGIWKNHLDKVRTTAGELQSEHLHKLAQIGKNFRLDENKGPIGLTLLKKDNKNK